MEKEISDDIRKHFSILQTIDITWSQEMVRSNFSRFYGVNLPVGIDKEEQCGGGEFRTLIVEDPSPNYDIRETSHGKEWVNTNMFDAKSRYRQWIGGTSIVHATNNSNEFNHDLTLLLGINSHDFQVNFGSIEHHIKKQQDIVGAHGWKSTEQLFYVLNNTINYVIIRGADGLERHEFCDNHRDCDLLVDNVVNAQSIINGEALDGLKRPHEIVNIDGYTYYLDLWGWDRYYFDIQWCKEMFCTKKEANGYYILNETNSFYCLLYHCLIIKGCISEDYLPLLESYREKHLDKNKEYAKILVDFLQQNEYEIVSDVENGAGFHINNPIINQYYNKYGRVISKATCIRKDIGTGRLIEWKSCVYENDGVVVKSGSDWLIQNEYSFIQKLSYSNHVVKCKEIKTLNGEKIITTKKINGLTLDQFFLNKRNYRKRIIKSVTQQILSILILLKSQNIIHRDFIGRNLIIDKTNKIHIIDFAWAIEIQQQPNSFLQPEELACKYRAPIMYSDFYTAGMVLDELAQKHLSYLENVSKNLCEIQWCDYFNEQSYKNKIKNVESAVFASFSAKDYFHCFLFRHPIISGYYYKVKHNILNK